MDTVSVLEALSKSKDELREKFNISRIGLFGSYSKGSQTEESDIDILYELNDGSNFGLKEILDLENYLKALLPVARIDLVDKKYINPIIELEIEDSIIYV